jgi:hypothetical protein
VIRSWVDSSNLCGGNQGLIQAIFVAVIMGADFIVLSDPFGATFIQVTTLTHPFYAVTRW